jgi:hypothetical protein
VIDKAAAEVPFLRALYPAIKNGHSKKELPKFSLLFYRLYSTPCKRLSIASPSSFQNHLLPS